MSKRKASDYFMPNEGPPTTKKFKRLERRVNALKPEMKHKRFSLTATLNSTTPFTTFNLTDVSQGDAVDRRTGNRIKVWRIEIRGICSSTLDTWIVQSHQGIAPTAAQFTTGFGSFIQDDDLNSKLTEWRHYRNLNETAADAGYKVVVRFKTGINVKYDGITVTPADNGLYFVGLSSEGADRTINLQARIWYTDI